METKVLSHLAFQAQVLVDGSYTQVNIQIIRTFTKLREMISTHTELRHKIENMEKKYETKFKVVFEAIACLLKDDAVPKKPMGFRMK